MKAELVVYEYAYEGGDECKGYSTKKDVGVGIVLTRDAGEPLQLFCDDQTGEVLRCIGMKRGEDGQLAFNPHWTRHLPLGGRYEVVRELTTEEFPLNMITLLFQWVEIRTLVSDAKTNGAKILLLARRSQDISFRAPLARLQASRAAPAAS